MAPELAKCMHCGILNFLSETLITPIHYANCIMITKKDLEHVSWLARIDLKEEEKEKYIAQLGSVLDYFGQLDEIDTNVPPTYHVLDITNILREDEPGTDRTLSQEDVLANAPKKKDGFFKAPRMM